MRKNSGNKFMNRKFPKNKNWRKKNFQARKVSVFQHSDK